MGAIRRQFTQEFKLAAVRRLEQRVITHREAGLEASEGSQVNAAASRSL
jgi:hypothetical protein